MMKDIENNISWVEQLEVTGPIKSIMGFVDELSINYDRRLKAMHADYQKDVEEMIVCYKQEKQDFQNSLEQLQVSMEKQEKELKILQQTYNILNVEHKITLDVLETAKIELRMLTKELHTEEELVKLTQDRIQLANDQLKMDSDEKITSTKTSKTRDFFKMIMESKAARALLLQGSNEEPKVTESLDSKVAT